MNSKLTVYMDMEAVLALSKTSDLSVDSALLSLNLSELDDTVDTGVSVFVEYTYSVVSVNL